jgi:hypothetical protein
LTQPSATIYAAISGNADVAALVGDRIYPGALPPDPVLPAVTYVLVSSPRVQTQTGPALANPRYRWNCFATEYDVAEAVAIAIAKAAKEGFNGWVEDESDRRETNTGLFRRRLETKQWITAPEAVS